MSTATVALLNPEGQPQIVKTVGPGQKDFLPIVPRINIQHEETEEGKLILSCEGLNDLEFKKGSGEKRFNLAEDIELMVVHP